MLASRPLKRIGVAVLLFLLLQVSIGTCAAAIPFDPSPSLIIMLMLDGFRPDYVTMYAPPNLQRLIAEGAWVAEARSVFPSMTTPNQTSFVTGALPASTGIPNNSRYDRQLDRFLSPLRDNEVPTIAEMMRDCGWRTASVNHFMLEHRGALRYVRGNMQALIRLLETERRGLVVYYHVNTDTVGHKSGPYSPQMRKAVLEADAEIGQLLSALERLQLIDQTTISIASDHGMSPTGGTPIQPNLTALALSGWKMAGTQSQIRSNTELVYIASGAAYLYWREGKRTPEREAELLEALRRIDGADIYTATDIARLGADPERLGDIAIVPHPGRTLASERSGGGKHGTPNEAQNMILFWGQGIKRGSIVPAASIIDIVPTLLRLARLDIPSSVDGRPLTQIIERTPWKERLGKAGDYEVKDIAASGGASSGSPAMLADGSIYTSWEISLVAGPAYVIFDFGVPRDIWRVEIVAVPGREAVGPQQMTLETSTDGLSFEPICTAAISPLTNGASETLRLSQPVKARFLRAIVHSSWGGEVTEIAEMHVWSGPQQ